LRAHRLHKYRTGDGPDVAAVSHLPGRAYEEETVSRLRPLARRRFRT
jgi:hypothetical protein